LQYIHLLPTLLVFSSVSCSTREEELKLIIFYLIKKLKELLIGITVEEEGRTQR